MLKAIDLFSGAGGFSLGLERAGFVVAGAFDNWDRAVLSHRENFSHPVHQLDLSSATGTDVMAAIGVSAGEVDLVVGGPPCQGFSVQRIGSDHDARNNLVLEFGRLVTEIRPRLFLMENVPGLLGKRGRDLVMEFLKMLRNAGYTVTQKIINAADYGVPQLRKRVLFAGWIEGSNPWDYPEPVVKEGNYRTVAEAFAGLTEPPAAGMPNPNDPLHRRTKLSPLNQSRIEVIPPGGGMQDLPHELKVTAHKLGAGKIGHRYVYGRLAPDRPAATITARFDSFTRGKFGHPLVPRNITLREGARLQSFPDSFKFCGSQEEVAAQIGNAVPPGVSEIMCRQAYKILSN